MKKFEVHITFYNGRKVDFLTDSDVRKLKPIEVNGARFIITKEEIGINVIHIKEMKVRELLR